MTHKVPNIAPPGREIATLAGGCFWCLEAVYDQLRGVDSVESGYMGGHSPAPTYKQVCEGDTGHAEVVRVTYDPSVVSFRDLLDVFFVIHDPTTLNRQGNDVGTQYRSAIFYQSPEHAEAFRKVDFVQNLNGRIRSSTAIGMSNQHNRSSERRSLFSLSRPRLRG